MLLNLNWKKFIRTLMSLLLASLLLQSCKDQREAFPKPHAYPRLDFPAKDYRPYENQSCAFGFDYPSYARIENKKDFFGKDIDEPCWFNLTFPEYNGTIHCSYYEINEKNRLDSLIYDSFALVGKHNIKAQYIAESKFDLKGKGGGMLFRITGPVASPTQFFITDSTEHFFRGSLYFNNKVEIDSMRLVYDFIDEDIDQMLKTFYWK
jgi:gliding motility-associated lipoprotein GldD